MQAGSTRVTHASGTSRHHANARHAALTALAFPYLMNVQSGVVVLMMVVIALTSPWLLSPIVNSQPVTRAVEVRWFRL